MTLRRLAKWIVDRSLLPLLQYLARNVVVTVRVDGAASSGVDAPSVAQAPAPPASAEGVINVRFAEPPAVTVGNLAPHLQGLDAWRYPRIMTRLAEIEVMKSVELIEKHLDHVHLAPTDRKIREYAMGLAPAAGLVLEFGVFNAESTNFLARLLSRKGDQRILHGFDSFEGLSDDGPGWVWEKGRFDLGGVLPKVAKNVTLHKGWIDDTLPAFLDEHPDETIAFIHVDVDIYGPAKTILTLCRPRLRPGSIVLFDELLGYAGWRFHEYRALTETFAESDYEFIAFSDSYQAAIRMK